MERATGKLAVGEFTVYPFVTDRLEPYVMAVFEEAERSGLSVDVGPLGTTVRGPLGEVLELLERVRRTAFASGATKIVTSVELDDEGK